MAAGGNAQKRARAAGGNQLGGGDDAGVGAADDAVPALARCGQKLPPRGGVHGGRHPRRAANRRTMPVCRRGHAARPRRLGRIRPPSPVR